MANNYLQFSETINELTEDELAWLKVQLTLPDRVEDEDFDKEQTYEFLTDSPDYDPDWCSLGFEYELHDVDEYAPEWGRHLWMYAEECGNPDNVAWLVQKFLKKFRPTACWSLTYASTCSKMRVGEFSGGAVFVTADEIKYCDSGDFVEDERKAFLEKKPKVAKKNRK